MERNTFYSEVITEHNIRPENKRKLIGYNMSASGNEAHCTVDGYINKRGVNPSCGDDITLELFVKDGIIEDGAFTGDGCAISQASADIMLDLVIGKSVEEANILKDKFLGMIKGTATPEDIEDLEEAGALQDISHMPARVKCAVLGWRTLEEMTSQKGGE